MSAILLQLLSSVIPSVLDRVLPEDPEKAAAAKLEMLKLAQDGELKELDASLQMALGQLEINKVEAGSDSLFKSGWRPATGWVCVSGLFYQLMMRPVAGWIMENTIHWNLPPSLEMDTLLTILFGLLGLGAYRTFEKVKGKA